MNSPFDHRFNRNISPRFRYAWSPGHDGRTNIRGGIGVYQTRRPGRNHDVLRRNPPGFLFPTFTQSTPIKPSFSLGTQNTAWPFGFTCQPFRRDSDPVGGLVRRSIRCLGVDPHYLTAHFELGVLESSASCRGLLGRRIIRDRAPGARCQAPTSTVLHGDLLDGNLDRLTTNFGSMDHLQLQTKYGTKHCFCQFAGRFDILLRSRLLITLQAPTI